MNRRRFLPLIALAFTSLLVLTGPAVSADDGPGPDFLYPDCTTEPIADGPGTGQANVLDPGPKKPRDGDPFAPNPKVSIYETYGYAGLEWTSVRPDCEPGPEAIYDAGGVGEGAFANMQLGWLATFTAFAIRVVRFVFESNFQSILNPILNLGSEAFGRRLFFPLSAVGMALIGAMVLFRSRKGNVKEAMSDATWAVTVVFSVVVLVAWPAAIAPKVDAALTGAVSMVNTELAGAVGLPGDTLADGAGANLHRALLYETWCAGTVGRPNGAAADEYCPKLWKASTFSRAEVAAFEDQDDRANAQEEKAEEYENIAQELRDEYPSAYSYLAGSKNGERIQYASVSWVGWWLSMVFILFSALLAGFSMLVVRALLFTLPLLALVGMFRPHSHYLLRAVDYAVISLRNALIFNCVTAAFLAALGGFLAPGSKLAPIWVLLIICGFAIATWCLVKGFRSFNLQVLRRTKKEKKEKKQSRERIIKEPGTERPDRPDVQAASAPNRYAGATPVEARRATEGIGRAATSGAVKGALVTAAAGVATGGTVTAGAMAAGAAKGAAGAAAANAAANRSANQQADGAAAAQARREPQPFEGSFTRPMPPGPTTGQPVNGQAASHGQPAHGQPVNGQAGRHAAGAITAKGGGAANGTPSEATRTGRDTTAAPREANPHIYTPDTGAQPKLPYAKPQVSKEGPVYPIYTPTSKRTDS